MSDKENCYWVETVGTSSDSGEGFGPQEGRNEETAHRTKIYFQGETINI